MAEDRACTASISRSTGHSVVSDETDPQVVLSANVLESEFGEQGSLSDSELYTLDRLNGMIGDGSVSSVASGGVPLVDPVELVRGLLSCDVRVVDAVGLVKEYYASVRQVAQEGAVARSATSSVVSNYSERRRAREDAWHLRVGAMPAVQGQCYLYPVRWARRDAYLRELGKAPTFRDFVAMLQPGDLCMKVAQSYCVYRLDVRKPGPDGSVVYHIDGPDYDDGVRIGTVYDCVAAMLRMYPFVNERYKCDVRGVDTIPLIGVVGWKPSELSAVRVSDVMGTLSLGGDFVPSRFLETVVAKRQDMLVDVANAMGCSLGATVVVSLTTAPSEVSAFAYNVPPNGTVSRVVSVSAPSVWRVPDGCVARASGVEVDATRVSVLLLCNTGVEFELVSAGSEEPPEPDVVLMPAVREGSSWHVLVFSSSSPVTLLHSPLVHSGEVVVANELGACRHGRAVADRYGLRVPWTACLLAQACDFTVARTVRVVGPYARLRLVRAWPSVYELIGLPVPRPVPDGDGLYDLEYQCSHCMRETVAAGIPG